MLWIVHCLIFFDTFHFISIKHNFSLQQSLTLNYLHQKKKITMVKKESVEGVMDEDKGHHIKKNSIHM
jgi:hypothetical protein